MGRRRQTDEIAFGSDSFLDIVANIVGILIILIVIAGIRVAQNPPDSLQTASSAAAAAEPLPALAIAAPTSPSAAEDLRWQPAPPVLEPIERPESVAPSQELLEQLASLRSELDRLDQTRQTLARQIEHKQQQTRTKLEELAAAQSHSQFEQQQIDHGRRTVAALQTELETCQRQIAGLHLELAELEADRPPPIQLRHKLTPIGKQPTGNNLYFLLTGDRVAVLPHARLMRQARSVFVASRSLMQRGKPLRKTFGPVNGFTLEFESRLISRANQESWRSSAAADDTQLFAEYTFRESAETRFESFLDAMEPQSHFLSECRRDASAQTLVFFVRPDSHAIYQSLKNFGYDNGFYVAAHLINEGEPVSGGTVGSPLVAQ